MFYIFCILENHQMVQQNTYGITEYYFQTESYSASKLRDSIKKKENNLWYNTYISKLYGDHGVV